MLKRILSICLICVLSIMTITPSVFADETDVRSTTGETLGVLKDEELGVLYLDATIDDFNEMGFEFGDSIDLVFSNGASLYDIPYYSGLYVAAGEVLLCGNPDYSHVALVRCYGDPMWDSVGATADTTVVVTMNEKQKYVLTQDLFQLTYSDSKPKGVTNEEFSNFRELYGGLLPEDYVYRSASPCNNVHGRATCTDDLAEKYEIQFVLNLSDSQKELDAYRTQPDYNSDYYDSLCASGKVLLLDLSPNYRSTDFMITVSSALYIMSQQEGPILIHCLDGNECTSFVCALVLALAGASQRAILKDYMITFKNYYGITQAQEPDYYLGFAALFNDALLCIANVDDIAKITDENLHQGAMEYLRAGGLTDEQIETVVERFSQSDE